MNRNECEIINSPANRAVQQQMRRAEQKKIIEEHDDHITHTSGTSHSGSGSGNKEEDDIYEFKSTPKDSSSGSGSEDNKPDNRKIDKRSISEEKNSDDPLSGIGSNNSGNISVSSISSKVNTNLTGSSSSGGSGNLNISSGNSGNNSGGGGGGGGGGGSSSSSSGGATKRVYSDIEGHDDTSTDGDELKKRRRNYCGDNTNKQGAGGRNTQSQRQEKGVKQSGGSNKSLGGLTGKNSTNLERKSPCPSPKSTSANKNTDSDTETDDNKNSDSFGNNGGPKVPPLKIVIPQQNPSGDNEVGPRNGKNNSTRNHQALPYVVASSSNSNDSVAADRESTSSRCGSPADSNGKNSSSSLAAGDEKSNMKGTSEERAQQRVLRSSHRGGQGVDRGSNNSSPQLQSSSPSPAGPNEKEDNSIEDKKVIGSSSTGGGTASGNGNSNKNNTNTNNPSPANNSSAQNSQTETESNAGNVPSPSASSTSSTSKEVPQGNVELHPRKRKIRANKQDDSSNKSSSAQSKDSQANSNESTSTVNEVHPHDHPFTNCYQMYLNIRKQIEKKHKSLMPIQPRPPQGFKDYLLNRKTYALAGKIPTEPVITIPKNLPNQMKELFTTQEKERYKLKTQHTIEREKLGLTVEQEILRVHAKAARSLACQSLPLSVCTIIKDQEVYNMITPEQEEKDRNARSRYNGRLFLSWLQDVDDKWEKIKESMLLRHHNEAESLHAVQKMDWEWLMKEHSLCDYKSQPVIDESHVPMVHVSDDFDLLPA
ncbi:uncharacterized transmembrane protein DDB_G0289901 isoform X2 [Condylostylus longicornis]|uniref:uncharacterized transmembrane protein DDB_G0289901 isoform X2 n=1 Tax=Condylostylus longicornis TaxID=2530218 RepID=UPI00244DF3AD|nr:uncharacterized transmembrane protein DDB_G0289901 isoform X2 [Condylostylus longicornis]